MPLSRSPDLIRDHRALPTCSSRSLRSAESFSSRHFALSGRFRIASPNRSDYIPESPADEFAHWSRASQDSDLRIGHPLWVAVSVVTCPDVCLTRFRATALFRGLSRMLCTSPIMFRSFMVYLWLFAIWTLRDIRSLTCFPLFLRIFAACLNTRLYYLLPQTIDPPLFSSHFACDFGRTSSSLCELSRAESFRTSTANCACDRLRIGLRLRTTANRPRTSANPHLRLTSSLVHFAHVRPCPPLDLRHFASLRKCSLPFARCLRDLEAPFAPSTVGRTSLTLLIWYYPPGFAVSLVFARFASVTPHIADCIIPSKCHL